MTKHLTIIVVAGVLITGCAHKPTSAPDEPYRVGVILEDVSLWDALHMYYRMSNGLYFTKDSLSQQELEKIRITVDMKDATVKEYLTFLGTQTGLRIEEVEYCLFRVVRKGKEWDANKTRETIGAKAAPQSQR